MKRVLALMLVLAFTACSSDDPTGSTGPTNGNDFAAEGARYRMTQAGVISDISVTHRTDGPLTATGPRARHRYGEPVVR